MSVLSRGGLVSDSPESWPLCRREAGHAAAVCSAWVSLRGSISGSAWCLAALLPKGDIFTAKPYVWHQRHP